MQLSDRFHNIHWKNLITAVAIPLAVGGLSAWITMDGMKAFEIVNQPPLTPPMWLFPVVWSILFVLMGIASYLVVMQKGEDTKALTLYAVQLIFNFFWSIWFFNLGWYLFAFLWLVALWILILATTVAFYRISKPAAWLMLPYLVWVVFAGYLNQDPQSDQPQKGEKIPSQVEEPDGPEKIKDKLYSIQGEGFRVLTFLHDNEIRGDSHEDEQDAPHHREEPHGRRQGRLIHCFKGFHTVFGDPGGESAYRQRDGNGSDEVFPVNIVKFVGELHGSLL